MIGKSAIRPHWSFWLIGIVALIWNLMGSLNFVMQLDADGVASYPESHRAIIVGRPAWATGGFAVAVFGGALGCVLLLLRKPSAQYLFLASLVGVIVTMIHTLRVAGTAADFTPFEVVLTMLMPVAVAIFLVWYSTFAERRSWIHSIESVENES